MAVDAPNKFTGEQDARHGGQLHYPGNMQGIPFRGPSAPTLPQDALLNLPVVCDFNVGLFDLMIPDQLANYIWVMDHVSNKKFRVVFLQRYWNPETGVVLVYVEWVQIYAQEAAKAGGR